MLFFFLFLPVFSGHSTYHIAFLRCSGHNRNVSDARAILFFLFVFTVRFLLLLLFLLHCVSFISEQDSPLCFSRRPFTLTSFLTFFKSTRLRSISSYPRYITALWVYISSGLMLVARARGNAEIIPRGIARVIPRIIARSEL